MLCFIVALVTEFLLVAEVVASSSQKCNAIEWNTCLQQCNGTSCKCGSTYGDSSYTTCKQACQGSKCKAISCSSGTCFQKCHNCHMECTSDVDYCSQQCLSGACSFKCNAIHCVQECNGRKCAHVTPVTCRTLYPRLYLVILAGLFAATSILSFLLLVMSCRETDLCKWNRHARYMKIRSVSSSLDSLYSLEAVAAWQVLSTAAWRWNVSLQA